MILTVAGNKKEYEDGITVSKLIEIEDVEMPLYVTVSVNEAFIDNDARDTTALKNGDEIEFIYFMGGGR